MQEGLAVVSNPRHLLDLARLGSGSATVLRKLVLRPPDPETLFRGELGIAKRATWSRPLSLADVKVVGRVIGGTVNDVILAAVTGAGDTVISSFVSAVAAGANLPEAAFISNQAAGMVVAELGTAQAEKDKLLKVIKKFLKRNNNG